MTGGRGRFTHAALALRPGARRTSSTSSSPSRKPQRSEGATSDTAGLCTRGSSTRVRCGDQPHDSRDCGARAGVTTQGSPARRALHARHARGVGGLDRGRSHRARRSARPHLADSTGGVGRGRRHDRARARGLRSTAAAASSTAVDTRALRRRRSGCGVRVGVVMMLTNFTSLMLYLPAMKDIARFPDPSSDKIVVTAVAIFVTSLAATLPLALRVVAPGPATTILGDVNRFVTRHQRAIVVIVAFAFGAYLMTRGLARPLTARSAPAAVPSTSLIDDFEPGSASAPHGTNRESNPDRQRALHQPALEGGPGPPARLDGSPCRSRSRTRACHPRGPRRRRDLESVLRERIVEPLGTIDTGFTVPTEAGSRSPSARPPRPPHPP